MSNPHVSVSYRSAIRVAAVFALTIGALMALPGVHAAETDTEEMTVEERLEALEKQAKETKEAEETEEAEEAEEAKKSTAKSWIDKIEILGDLRLRYEGFNWPNKFDDGRRDRFRYRLRLGFKAHLHETLNLGIELRSGNFRDPVSDNTSFDAAGTKDEIAIAQAFVNYRPVKDFWVQAGKSSPKKLWHVSDMAWDDDAVVNGAIVAYDRSRDGFIKQADVRGYGFVGGKWLRARFLLARLSRRPHLQPVEEEQSVGRRRL